MSAGLITMTVISGLRYAHYQGRLTAFSNFDAGPLPPLDEYKRQRLAMEKWRKITLLSAVATIASGVFTTGLWFRHQRKADFSVQPEDDGASVAVSGSF